MIDWKHIATTEGYKSLKAAYTRDVQKAATEKRPMRKKDEFLRHFQWVMNRAKHYAHHTGKTIDVILNEWEEKRDSWWLGYYGSWKQPRFHSNSKKPMSLQGMIKNCKHSYSHDPRRLKLRRIELARTVRPKRTKKPRWEMRRKKRGY